MDDEYTKARHAYLCEKFRCNRIQLDDSPPHTFVQKNCQEYIDEQDRRETEQTKRFLALGSTQYQGKLLKIWMDVFPDR
jgi:hypothetical protein